MIKAVLKKSARAALSKLPHQLQVKLVQELSRQLVARKQFQYGLLSMWDSLQSLKINGFIPATVIDVGAYVGDWSRTAAQIFSTARFHLVEAQPDKEVYLRKAVAELGKGSGYTMALLGPTRKDRVPFFSMETGSSVLPEQTSFERKTLELQMRTLDEIVDINRLLGPFLLKLDVQGYELEVLSGALSRTLPQTEVILMEVSLLTYNAGAPLLAEAVRFMKEKGFVAFDICSQSRRQSDKALYQIDILFTREEHPLRSAKPFFENAP
jgi:FkbM family methyltransferase